MKLETTKDRVLEAASKCSQAKETLKTLFPEAFVSKQVEDFERDLQQAINNGAYYDDVYSKLPGADSYEKAALIVKLLGLK